MPDYYDRFTSGIDDPSSDVAFAFRQANQGGTEGFGQAAFEEAMSPFAVSRMYERRSSQFAPDEDWAIDEKVQAQLDLDYNRSDTAYLEESKSEAEFIARKGFIEEDQERQRKIASAGLKGIAANVGFSLFDPAAIAIGLASGGIGWGAKLTGAAKAAKIAALSGIENAAVEVALSKGNTQAGKYDVLVALGAGAAIGGALSPLIRTAKPAVADIADEFDRAVNDTISTQIGLDLNTQIRASEPVSVIDTRAVKRSIREHELGLSEGAEGALTAGQETQIRKRISELQDQIAIEDEAVRAAQAEEVITKSRERAFARESEFAAEIEPLRAEIRAESADALAAQEKRVQTAQKNLERKPNDNKRAAKLFKEEDKLAKLKEALDKKLRDAEVTAKKKVRTAATKARRSLTSRISEITTRRAGFQESIKGLEAQLGISAAGKESKNKLKAFQKLSEEAQAKELFGDKVPMRVEELAKQNKAIEPAPSAPEPSTVDAKDKGTAGALAADASLVKPFDVPFDAESSIRQLAHDGAKVPDDLRGRRLFTNFTKALQSIQTRLSNSKSYATRGLNWHLFEAAQGGTAAPVTAAARVKNNSTIIRSAMRNRLNEGLEEWGTENGLSLFQTLMNKENFSSYHKKVMIEVKYPGTYQSEGIIKGAAGVRDQLHEAGRIRKDAGEAGFENLDLDKNYVPIIVDETLVKNAASPRNHGRAKVEAVLSRGYQEGHFKLNPELADRVAKGYVDRSLNNSLTMRDAARKISGTDVDKLVDDLRLAGVDEAAIEDFMDVSMTKEINQHISNRAKKSLFPDIRVEVNGLKMIDLIDSDMPKLLESYTRDAAGGAAMAKLGFKTRQQVIDTILGIEKQARNLGHNATEAAEEAQVMLDGVDMLYGRSINKDAHSPLVRNLGRLRDITSFLRLQSVGIASIPELARITVKRGIGTVIEGVPDLGIGISGTKKLREGGKYSGHFKRKDLEELDTIIGYAGEDHILYPNGLRVDNLEESGFHNNLGSKIDNALAQGKRVQEIVSAFRLVQGGGEKLAVRSLASNIKKWALKGGKGLSEADIKNAGWFEDDFLDSLKAFMKDNPETTEFNGRTVDLFNFGKMPPEMQERLQIGMHRLVARDMQRPFIGETPVLMHKWLGQTVTQFRSFSLLSFEKQLLADIRHDRIAGSLIMMQSAALAYGALTINAMLRGIGREDADEYIANQLTGTNAVLGVFNRMGQFASAGIALDGLATLGALPDDMMAAPGQTGYRGLTSSSVPVVGAIGDVKDVAQDMFKILKGDGDANKTITDIQNVTPFGKAIGINQAFNALAR